MKNKIFFWHMLQINFILIFCLKFFQNLSCKLIYFKENTCNPFLSNSILKK